MSRRKRLIALVVASIVGCLVPNLLGSVGATGQSAAQTYRVTISGAASTVRCQFAAAFSGPLVRDFEFPHESPTVGEVVINTQRNGKPAATLTAFVYCAGFGISAVEATALDGAGARTTRI